MIGVLTFVQPLVLRRPLKAIRKTFFTCGVNRRETSMICIKVEIPEAICDINDELKAIYHSSDKVCIWVSETREDRNVFVDVTAGTLKSEREKHF